MARKKDYNEVMEKKIECFRDKFKEQYSAEDIIYIWEHRDDENSKMKEIVYVYIKPFLDNYGKNSMADFGLMLATATLTSIIVGGFRKAYELAKDTRIQDIQGTTENTDEI